MDGLLDQGVPSGPKLYLILNKKKVEMLDEVDIQAVERIPLLKEKTL
jgi:hypothetical protein